MPQQKKFIGITLDNKNSYIYAIAFLIVGIISRIIPHMPNATALTFVSLASGFLLPRYFALLGVLFTAFCSDLLISYLYHFPLLGSWTLFTYSGFLGLSLAANYLKKITLLRSYICLFSASFIFWLWTNCGVWLTSGMYAKTFAGLISCFIAAIPFLTSQWTGDLIWLTTFIIVINFSRLVVTKTANVV